VTNSLILENLLLLDIETVPAHSTFQSLNPSMQELWLEKFTKIAPETDNAENGYENRAGIYAEFGKIICISAGHFQRKDEQWGLRIKSFYGDDEAEVISSFLAMIQQYAHKNRDLRFSGHNIREFDIPFICRRSIINQIPLPSILHLHGMKPWEVQMTDTLHLWRFGDIKHYTSLKLLAAIMDIPTPKDDIDGSMVAATYWQQNDLPRIVTYCEKDVITVAQILLRFKELPLLSAAQIETVN
jgi:3'-5' exonuclease